jgi:hypothetical protein
MKYHLSLIYQDWVRNDTAQRAPNSMGVAVFLGFYQELISGCLATLSKNMCFGRVECKVAQHTRQHGFHSSGIRVI